jgi:hypothetical protein
MRVVITGHKVDKDLSDFAGEANCYHCVYYRVESGEKSQECVSKIWRDKSGDYRYMITDLFVSNMHDGIQDKIEEALLNYCRKNKL